METRKYEKSKKCASLQIKQQKLNEKSYLNNSFVRWIILYGENEVYLSVSVVDKSCFKRICKQNSKHRVRQVVLMGSK